MTMLFLVESYDGSIKPGIATIDDVRSIIRAIGDDIEIPDMLARGFGCDLYQNGSGKPVYHISRWS
jgi:hypothetical protein